MISLAPIGNVHNSIEQFPADYQEVVSEIRLNPIFREEALLGLTDFSHLAVIFYFHKAARNETQLGYTEPLPNMDQLPPAGIFALRTPKRPNNLGLTVVELLGVEGTTIIVKGLDALNGTPILDVKPCVSDYLPKTNMTEPDWAMDRWEFYER